jgi:hypothetical protein
MNEDGVCNSRNPCMLRMIKTNSKARQVQGTAFELSLRSPLVVDVVYMYTDTYLCILVYIYTYGCTICIRERIQC